MVRLKGRLSDEHVVPFGLNGAAVLPAASCSACADITGALEGYCQGKMLGNLRNALGFRTRKKKMRASHLTLSVKYADGSEGELTVPASEYPATMALPIFPIARALRGLPPDKLGQTTDGGGPWFYMQKDRLAALHEKYGVEEINVPATMEPLKFARFVAKVAHVGAVADFGIEEFQHLTPPMILGHNDTMNYLVGCGGFEDLPPVHLHNGKYMRHEETGMWVALVRLFATFGAPTYHVVVGLRPGGRISRVF